jgi:hypothetical protein
MSTPQSQPSKPPLARHKQSAQPSANALNKLRLRNLDEHNWFNSF